MTGRFPLRTNNLPSLSPLSEEASVNSPARGQATRTALLQKLRPPPLLHAWEFWHEKPTPSSTPNESGTIEYKPHLSNLHSVTDVRTFWSLFNNFDFSVLPLRTAVHLFHKGVKPIWEDERNIRGGSWTFRVPKANGVQFWREICLLAIADQLQEAVRDDTRTKFRDDICGVSFMPRVSSVTLVCIWNRDGDNKAGIQNILDTVMENTPDEVKPAEGNYYYKKHSAHAAFNKQAVTGTSTTPVEKEIVNKSADETPVEQRKARQKTEDEDLKEALAMQRDKSAEMAEKMDAMEKEVLKLRKILESVRLRDEQLAQSLAKEVGDDSTGADLLAEVEQTPAAGA